MRLPTSTCVLQQDARNVAFSKNPLSGPIEDLARPVFRVLNTADVNVSVFTEERNALQPRVHSCMLYRSTVRVAAVVWNRGTENRPYCKFGFPRLQHVCFERCLHTVIQAIFVEINSDALAILRRYLVVHPKPFCANSYKLDVPAIHEQQSEM